MIVHQLQVNSFQSHILGLKRHTSVDLIIGWCNELTLTRCQFQKEIGAKAARKMLVKLTAGHFLWGTFGVEKRGLKLHPGMCIAAMRMILPYPTLATSPQQTQFASQNIYMKDINFKTLLILSLIDFFSNYLKRRVKWPEFLPPKFTRGWGEFDVRDENAET